MARPLLKQELTFAPDAATADSVAYFPDVLAGQYIEWTVYIEFSSGAAAGKAQIQTAFAVDPVRSYGGTWANVGNTIDFSAASSQKYASVTGVFDLLRINIDTTVTTGTMKAYVIAASHPA
jgi:hypothetical protein